LSALSTIQTTGHARNISATGDEKVPQVIVGRWGKNLAVRLPGQIAKAAGLTDGEHVEFETRDGDIVIRRPVPRFTLDELFKGKSARQWRKVYAAAFDWGPQGGGQWGTSDHPQ
jgi:antitoxin MazE